MTNPEPQPKPSPPQDDRPDIWTGRREPKPPPAMPGPYGAPGPEGREPRGSDPLAPWDYNPDYPTGGGNFNPDILIDTSMAASSGGKKGEGMWGDFQPIPGGAQGMNPAPQPAQIDHHEMGYQLGRALRRAMRDQLAQIENWFN